MSYNGWTNYETWCVNLWLINQEGSNDRLMDLVSSTGKDYHKAMQLKEEIEDMNPLVQVGVNNPTVHATSTFPW